MRRRVESARVWKVSSCDGMYIHYNAYTGRVKPFPMRFSDPSFCGHFAGHSPPHRGLPAPDPSDKKFNSRPVAPTTLKWCCVYVAVVLNSPAMDGSPLREPRRLTSKLTCPVRLVSYESRKPLCWERHVLRLVRRGALLC